MLSSLYFRLKISYPCTLIIRSWNRFLNLMPITNYTHHKFWSYLIGETSRHIFDISVAHLFSFPPHNPRLRNPLFGVLSSLLQRRIVYPETFRSFQSVDVVVLFCSPRIESSESSLAPGSKCSLFSVLIASQILIGPIGFSPDFSPCCPNLISINN